MTVLRIQAKVDSDKPLFPEHLASKVGKLVGVGILEKGMVSGKTSMALIIEAEDGVKTVVELSTAEYLTIAGGVKGAMARFGDDPSGYA